MRNKTNHMSVKRGLFLFEQPIYPFDLYVYVGTEDLSHIFNNYPHETDFHARTLFLRNKENNHKSLLINFCDAQAMTLDFIVHECVHAANAALYDIGQDSFHNIGQDESYCYLVEWMTKCCDETRNIVKGSTRKSFKGKLIRI